MMLYYVIAGLMSMVGMYVQNKLKAKFKMYNRIPNPSQKSGLRIAQEMLEYYDIADVKIVQGQGTMTDHYNPLTKTVSLSPAVYQGGSVIAAAVAAHECGHAVQHAQSYKYLKFRSAMVPLVKRAAAVQQFGLFAALMLLSTFPQLLLIVLLTFMVTTAFSLMTLPVEFDASNRALAWLEASGNVVGQSMDGAKDALKWAAMTYVAAALSSLAMFAFVALMYFGRR